MKPLLTTSLRFLLYIIFLAPLLLFAVYTFADGWFFPAPFPTQWSLTFFERALDDPRTLGGMWDGMVISIIASILSLLLAFPAARTLGLRRFRGRQLVWLLFFLPTIVPPLAIGMGLNILFLRLGLAGTLFGVSLAHLISTLPYTVFTLSSAFERYDENYEHQALALGASPLQIFFNVTLRMMTPSLVVATLFAFLVSWSQYLLTLLIGGGKVITLPILFFSSSVIASSSMPNVKPLKLRNPLISLVTKLRKSWPASVP